MTDTASWSINAAQNGSQNEYKAEKFGENEPSCPLLASGDGQSGEPRPDATGNPAPARAHFTTVGGTKPCMDLHGTDLDPTRKA